MKKLPLLLFSLILSINSFAGGLDGKGLKCKCPSEYCDNPRPFYVWFQDNKSHVPVIVGDSLRWWGGYRYTEEGTRYVDLHSDLYNNPYRFDFPVSVLWYNELDRVNLTLGSWFLSNTSLNLGPSWYCSVIYNEDTITSELQRIINSSSGANKI